MTAWITGSDDMKWNMSQKYIASWSLHPEKRTPKTVKKRYKIDLDFDVIYTKHMLIIYLKIIYYLFSTKHNFVHDPLKTKQCRVFRFENMDDVGKPTGCSSFWGEIVLAYLQSINKQKYTRCAFGIPEMPMLNLLNSGEPHFPWAKEYLCGARTQKPSESCGKQAFTLQVPA